MIGRTGATRRTGAASRIGTRYRTGVAGLLNKAAIPPYHWGEMLPPRRLSAALALTAVLLVARAGSASLILALDLPSLVSRAENIAVVDVVSVKAAWNQQHQRIITTIDLAVVDSWKGTAAPATHLFVVQPGGTVDDITQTIAGMTHFEPGERALVFLRGRPEKASVVGMAQGKRAIHRVQGTQRWMVSAPDRAGADFVRATPAASAAPVFETRDRPLADLRAEIRTLTAAPGGRR